MSSAFAKKGSHIRIQDHDKSCISRRRAGDDKLLMSLKLEKKCSKGETLKVGP